MGLRPIPKQLATFSQALTTFFRYEAHMTHLSIEEVMSLLGIEAINGTPKQKERLRKWIEGLVEKRGNDFVLENRQELLRQLEQHMKLKTQSCC
jgi:ribosomal protein L17